MRGIEGRYGYVDTLTEMRRADAHFRKGFSSKNTEFWGSGYDESTVPRSAFSKRRFEVRESFLVDRDIFEGDVYAGLSKGVNVPDGQNQRREYRPWVHMYKYYFGRGRPVTEAQEKARARLPRILDLLHQWYNGRGVCDEWALSRAGMKNLDPETFSCLRTLEILTALRLELARRRTERNRKEREAAVPEFRHIAWQEFYD